MYYIKCPYCNDLCLYDHLDNCFPNYKNELIHCYSCEESQLNKEHLARCKSCVSNNIKEKYKKYDKINNINIEFEYHIENFKKIKELLYVNPNYHRQKSDRNGYLLYNEDGTEVPEDDDGQPYNPLRLYVFSISNCNNKCSDYKNIFKTAKLLIKFGANSKDALDYYLSRYDDPRNHNFYLLKNDYFTKNKKYAEKYHKKLFYLLLNSNKLMIFNVFIKKMMKKNYYNIWNLYIIYV